MKEQPKNRSWLIRRFNAGVLAAVLGGLIAAPGVHAGPATRKRPRPPAKRSRVLTQREIDALLGVDRQKAEAEAAERERRFQADSARRVLGKASQSSRPPTRPVHPSGAVTEGQRAEALARELLRVYEAEGLGRAADRYRNRWREIGTYLPAHIRNVKFEGGARLGTDGRTWIVSGILERLTPGGEWRTVDFGILIEQGILKLVYIGTPL